MTVSTSAYLPTSIDLVWDLISDFGNLKRWHPLVESCELSGIGEGATRTVHFADWWASEKLDCLDQLEHRLVYLVTDSSRPAVIDVRGEMRLTCLPCGGTQIDWKSGLEPDNPFASEVNAGLEAYYPVRIGHLRIALGIAG